MIKYYSRLEMAIAEFFKWMDLCLLNREKMTPKKCKVNIKLTDIVALDFLQNFQDKFAKSVNVASIMVDDKGPITKPSNFTDFCIKYTRGSKEGYKRCNNCDIKWGKLAAKKGEPVIYTCHSGLTDFAVPIMLDGQHIASILGGQVLTRKPDEDHFKKIAKELEISVDEYIKALRKVKVIPFEQVKAAAELMYVVANSISVMAKKNFELIRKEQEAKKIAQKEIILRKIIEIARSSLEMQEIKKRIVDELGKAFKADRCYFRSYDRISDKFFAPDVEYLSSPDIKSLLNIEPDQEGLKYFSNELRKRSNGFYPVVANEDIAKGTPLETYMKSAEMKADYAMPIIDNDEGFTWLVLHYSSKDPNFDDDYKKLLETIAFQVDMALRQIKLYNTTKQQAEREKAILSNLPFMVWLKDSKSRLLAVNEPYAKMCGTTIDKVIGKTDYDFFPAKNADAYVAEDKEVMKLGKTKSVEELIQGSGGPKWHETYKTPLLDEKGNIIGTTGFARDITERKEIDRMKNEFVSTVSHELRTPLTSLRGSLGLIASGKMGDLSEKIKGLLDIANNNCSRLINLINDILDIEKIEAGKMDFDIKTFELMALINQAIQLNFQFAQKFNVKINFVNLLNNVFVQIDESRLIQVITNLLSNAIKFSEPESSVDISVIRFDENVRVSITNYGAEIPSSFKTKIFQKFAQADSSDSKQKGGTGLGLSISKAIIEKMDGNIGFSSENNETTFYFELPEASESIEEV